MCGCMNEAYGFEIRRMLVLAIKAKLETIEMTEKEKRNIISVLKLNKVYYVLCYSSTVSSWTTFTFQKSHAEKIITCSQMTVDERRSIKIVCFIKIL